MIKLDFQINKYYLAYLVVNQSNKLANQPSAELLLATKLKNLQKRLVKNYKNNPAYYFIYLAGYKYIKWAIEQIYLSDIEKSHNNQLEIISKDIQKIFQTIFNSQEFETILKETIEYKNFVEHQWNQNKSFVFNYLEEVLGKKLANLSIKIIIVHPVLNKGHAVLKQNLIVWGHNEDWQNYATVYLAHEITHILFNHYKIKLDNLSHALIELITDNELRIRLNQKGKYFREGRKHVGHPGLRQMEKQILPSWCEYLQNKKKNLSLFLNQFKK